MGHYSGYLRIGSLTPVESRIFLIRQNQKTGEKTDEKHSENCLCDSCITTLWLFCAAPGGEGSPPATRWSIWSTRLWDRKYCRGRGCPSELGQRLFQHCHWF